MKEYIEKEKLTDYLFDESEEKCREINRGEIVTYEDLDRIGTVTRADILMEYQEKMKQIMCDSCVEHRVNQCEGEQKAECDWMKKIEEELEEKKNE